MQKALLDTHYHGQRSLTHSAFDTLINYSESFYFLLDNNLIIQNINQKASDFFSINKKAVIKEHLPSWFIRNGIMPPVIHAEGSKNESLEKGFQTKFIKSDQAYLIDWEYQWILSSDQFTEGLLLRGSVHVLLPNTQLNLSLSVIPEKPSILDAIYHHFNQLTLLAHQTLQNQQLDSIGLKVAMQTILQSIDKSKQLLSFASSLEKCNYSDLNSNKTVVLQKIFQSIIEKYESEHSSFNVQIVLENHQTPLSVKQLCDKDLIHLGLTALILPILCFLDKGFVKINFIQKTADSKIGLTHIQCKIKGEDAFGHTIQDWFTLQDETIKKHQILYLHWLLGKDWLERLNGHYQFRVIASEVHIDMMLPFEIEAPVPVSKSIHENVPLVKPETKPRSAVTFDYQNDQDPLTQELRNTESIAILLIEDNEMNKRAVLQIIHRIYGNVYFKVASCAQEASKAYQQASYDLILMDIGLPDNQGLQLAYQLRQLELELGRQPSPICILSAHYSRAMYEEECETALKDTLIQGFYAKPLLPLKAQELIDYWIPNAIKRRYEVHA